MSRDLFLEDNPLSAPSTQVLLRLHRLRKNLHLSQAAHEAVETLLLPRPSPLPTPSFAPGEALWQEAVQAGDLDLAWRTLCVLRHQGPLPVYAERVWALLGEGGDLPRMWFPLHERSLELILQSAPTAVQPYLRSYLQLRPCLQGLFPQKVIHLPGGLPLVVPSPSLVAKCRPWKKHIPWLFPKPLLSAWLMKARKNPTPTLSLPPWIPPAEAAQESVYVLTTLADGLGYSRWNWDLVFLQQQLHLASSIPHPMWRTFSASQRVACLQWGKLQAPSISLETLEQGMRLFILQCALVVLQDHTLWMRSLANWESPAWLQEAFANWILSPAYSQIRAVSPHRFVLAIPPVLKEHLK